MTPPVVLVALAYGAGLATGLARFWVPAVALALLLAWAGHHRRIAAPLLLIVGLLGALEGELARRTDSTRCAARLPTGDVRLVVRAHDPVPAAGGTTDLSADDAGCRGLMRARLSAGRPINAGDRLLVTGRWIARPGPLGRPDGILVVRSVRPLDAPVPASLRLRGAILRTTARLFGPRAPMVDALMLNRRADFDPELRQRYAESGLVHLLSISGFHLGLLAAWAYLAFRALRFRRESALLLAAALGWSYVALIGWPAPAVRAAALTSLLATARLRQRSVRPDALLAVTCLLVLLVDPWAIADLGAWLSASSLWGATIASRWSDRALGASWWWRTASGSIGATLATAPITAAAFGTVAVVGIGLNLVAIPLAGVAVPGVAASLLTAPLWPSLAAALAAGAGAALAALDLLATLGAKVPGGHIVSATGLSAAWPWVALLGVVLFGIRGGATARVAAGRWAWAAVLGAWGSLAWLEGPLPTHGGSNLTLHFLDVGQGDGAVIRTPAGHWLVVDAGPRTDHSDAGRRVVAPFLARQGVHRLSALIVSHAHADHLGGVEAVLERIPADLVLEPGELIPDPLYLGFLDDLAASATPWRAVRAGDSFELDSVRFQVLHPDTSWAEWGWDLNEDSVVLLVRYRGFAALFAGDAGMEAERRLHGRVGRVDVLKVGHHGSRSATSDSWLAELAPKAAVISVGEGNRYGHPAPEALQRLAAHGVEIWRTDRDGMVSVETDGRRMTIRAAGREETKSVDQAQPDRSPAPHGAVP